MKLAIPYGKEVQQVEIADRCVMGVLHPNSVVVGDEMATLTAAISSPLQSRPFDEFLSDARDVLFIVNDGTRPTPTAKILDILQPKIPLAKSRFLIATGVHRAPTAEEYDFIFGRHYPYLKERIYVHDCRKQEEMVHIGTSVNGTEMYVNRMGVEADKIVIIGSVEPHYFAGYTGGRKSFLPGIASYATIEQNHKHALRLEAKALALEGNPVHEDMIDALRSIADKEIFSIQTVLDRERRIYAAAAGDLYASFRACVDKANEVFAVKIGAKADVVVSVAPYPMDVDLYQSQKALDNGKLALKEGGTLIMVSKCRTGIGERTFFDLLSSCDSPQATIERIGREFKLGYHKAAKMAEINTWAQVWAVTDLPDADLEAIFIRPFPSVQQALDAALAEKGPDCQVIFLMDGSITVPLLY